VPALPVGLFSSKISGSHPDQAKIPFTVQIFQQLTIPFPYFLCPEIAIFLDLVVIRNHCLPWKQATILKEGLLESKTNFFILNEVKDLELHDIIIFFALLSMTFREAMRFCRRI
jgi:hypothetical protein